MSSAYPLSNTGEMKQICLSNINQDSNAIVNEIFLKNVDLYIKLQIFIFAFIIYCKRKANPYTFNEIYSVKFASHYNIMLKTQFNICYWSFRLSPNVFISYIQYILRFLQFFLLKLVTFQFPHGK